MSPRLHRKTRDSSLGKDKEHGYRDKDSVIYNHIINCKGVDCIVCLSNINNNRTEREKLDRKIFGVNIFKEKTSIIDKARRWDILLFKEVLKIKE